MRWAGHVARMGEDRGVHRVLVVYFIENSSIDTRLYITGLKEHIDIKISLNMDGMYE